MSVHASRRRAQVSLEFVIVAGFAVLLLVAMLTIALAQIRTATTEGTQSGMYDVALSIQQELLTARSVGDGYEREFTLPGTIQGRTYAISLLPDGNASIVLVTLAGKQASVRAPRCDGTLARGTNRIVTTSTAITCAPVVP